MHQKYAQNVYREDAMPDYFSDVIEKAIRRIAGGHVCDLGSHAVGHYWAMGYVERVDSYSCYDLSAEAIAIFNSTLQNWQPGDLVKKHGYYMNWLYERGIITQPPEDVERQLLEKMAGAYIFDFLKDTPDRQYDTVLANESLCVVDSYAELVQALGTAHAFLKDGGLLINVTTPYERLTADIEKMQDYKIASRFNPSAETFEKAMREVGFHAIATETYPIKNVDGYPRLDITTARRQRQA